MFFHDFGLYSFVRKLNFYSHFPYHCCRVSLDHPGLLVQPDIED